MWIQGQDGNLTNLSNVSHIYKWENTSQYDEDSEPNECVTKGVSVRLIDGNEVILYKAVLRYKDCAEKRNYFSKVPDSFDKFIAEERKFLEEDMNKILNTIVDGIIKKHVILKITDTIRI